jgi:hypothetical protein
MVYSYIRRRGMVRISEFWLAPWDDFRRANWNDIVDTPELMIQQTHQLLHLFK